MATRIESLGTGKSPRGTVFVIVAICAVAATIAVAALTTGGGPAAPARPNPATEAVTLEPPAQVEGLVKAGLQPRPFSEIPVAEVVVPAVAPIGDAPAGFIPMPGGDFRPRPYGA
ncbi:MAG TPA: hypothetical protein VIC58_08105 [Actinomycetota bacterium]|jgi:hypothetical protein